MLGDAFSAHPHLAPGRRAIYNFGLRIRPWGCFVDLYELPLAGKARRLSSTRFPGIVSLHDFIVTERHAIFFGAPLRLRWLDLIFKRKTIADSLAWRPELGCSILVVPLDAPHEPVRFEADPFMLFHFANAFERGRELVVDFVRYDDYAGPDRVIGELMAKKLSHDGGARLTRAVLDLEKKTLKTQPLWDRGCEFPVVARGALTRAHRKIYLVAHSPEPGSYSSYPTRIASIDAETGKAEELSLGPECYPSEAVFAPRPGGAEPDDGWLLSVVCDANAKTSFLAVLDARDLGRGVLAKAWFDHALPMSFHGTWSG